MSQWIQGFFEKAGLKGRMPHVIACGSRQRAYDQFCAAINEAETGSFIVLLVDSESAVKAKGAYRKGRHSFDLLGGLDPSKVMEASPHARRFIDALKRF